MFANLLPKQELVWPVALGKWEEEEWRNDVFSFHCRGSNLLVCYQQPVRHTSSRKCESSSRCYSEIKKKKGRKSDAGKIEPSKVISIYVQVKKESEPYAACWTTRECSKRYTDSRAPETIPAVVNVTSRYFPKREELSLMPVLALPNASMMGFIIRIFSSRSRLGA